MAVKQFLSLLTVLLLTACPQPPTWRLADVSGKLPPLDFSLTDMEGKVRHGSDYQGKITLLFTGFTHCPGICPVTLARLATVLGEIEGSDENFQVLFVSLDPERDTPGTLKTYVQRFGSGFVGLTGTQEQLDTLVQRYFLSYRKDLPDTTGNYNVIHSDIIVIFDRQGKARLLGRSNTPIEDLREDLEQLREE